MALYRSSPPDTWTSPRPHRDPSLRLQAHGPLVPMDADDCPAWINWFVRAVAVAAVLFAVGLAVIQ